MSLVVLPEVAQHDALLVGYLRRVMARASGRVEVYGAGQDFHSDVVGALGEVAVALTFPHGADVRWFALTAHEDLPKVDLLFGDHPVDVHATHHQGPHLILQEDDATEVEHVLVTVNPDASVCVHGSTGSLDIEHADYVEQGRAFSRFEGHTPRALRHDQLQTLVLDQAGLERRALGLSRELWKCLAMEETLLAERCNGLRLRVLHERFEQALAYMARQGDSRLHVGHKLTNGLVALHAQRK